MSTSTIDAVARPGAATEPPPRPADAGNAPDAEPRLAVRVRGLRCAYGDHEVVHGIDLDVSPGEVVAVLGPNGAGKTTTMEVLEGFRTAAAGEVSVLGEDPAAAGAAWRERLGVVLQDSAPEKGLTVRECVRLYAGYYRAPRPVDEVIALVGLAEQADARADALSGGQRRRLDVALGLVGDPELLFLDEPTTGFDPSARRAAWDVVDALRALGTTILLTTHHMEEAERLADRIVVVAGGRVVAEGTPRTLAGRDRAAADIAFVLPPGVAPDDLPRGLAERVASRPGGRVGFSTDHVAADLHHLGGWAVERGVELHELEVRRPTLEDVYLELTR